MAGSRAFQIIGDFNLSADIVQDAFLKAYSALPQLRDPNKFKSWLMGIVRTTAIDWQRKQKNTVSLDSQDFSQIFSSSDPSPEEALSKKEKAQLVWQVLSEMPEDYREVLVLKHMEDLSYKEIARRCNTTTNTIESRLFRARKVLKKKWLQLKQI